MIPNTLDEQLPSIKNVGGCYKDVERSRELITCSQKKHVEKKKTKHVQQTERFQTTYIIRVGPHILSLNVLLVNNTGII